MRTLPASRLWWHHDDEELQRIVPYIRLQGGGGGGRVTPRIELPAPPPHLAALARSMTRRCVNCGTPCAVFRDRTVGYPGGAVAGNLYMTVLCTKEACTHGNGRLAYADLARWIEQQRPPQGVLV